MATGWINRDSVFAALTMTDVLNHYEIEAGNTTSFRIQCPFHEDQRPSCSINTKEKLFNCFGCAEQGNILDFIAGMEGLDPKSDFRKVLEKAISILGHNPTPKKQNKPRQKQSVEANANDTVTGNQSGEMATEPNPDKKPKKTKLKGDKKSKKAGGKKDKTHKADETPNIVPNRILEGPAFPLKLTTKHPWLDEQCKRIGLDQDLLEEFGIGYEVRSNALMAGRVCFPIHYGNGDLVAYAGRWASDDCDADGRFFNDQGSEQPRYRLPKGFCKQLELFNLHRIREKFNDTNVVVLVEGFWSALRLHQFHIPVVALMGVSISDAQVHLLKDHGIQSVIIVMDGDKDGQAAVKSLLTNLSSHLFVRVLTLPNGTKPDDVDQSVLRDIKKLISEATE